MQDTPVVAINGPRQVGKSTLASGLLQRFPGVLVTLDDEAQSQAANDDARGFVERGHSGPLIIDEVQLAPPLFRALKAAVDRDRRPGRFVLTGSTRLLSAEGFADAFVGHDNYLPLKKGNKNHDACALTCVKNFFFQKSIFSTFLRCLIKMILA